MTKSSGKLGITIPQLSQNDNPSDRVIRLTLQNQSGQASFLALAAPWVTIPTKVCAKLDVCYDDALSIIELKPIQSHSQSSFKVEGEKIDMLSIIPPTSGNGYPIYVDEYEKAGETWLRIWYCHPRGAARQIELRRYVDATKLGRLLGLLQAEGDKRSSRVGFKNSAIAEHTDLISGLLGLGVPSTLIHGRCVFNPNKSSLEAAYEYAELFRSATGIPIGHFNRVEAMKGAIAADTSVRSSTLASILLTAMSEVRRGKFHHESLCRNFLAKLLSGDGSLDARRTPKRLDVRLTIVDRDIEALRDYAEILSREGFKAKVLIDRITIRAYCTWLNLIRLYEIGAFRNGRNWIKLLCAIKITTQGRVNRGYKRIQELSALNAITSGDVSAKYGIGSRASSLWIHTMHRKGMMETMPTVRGDRLKKYRVTAKGKEMARILEAVERDYDEIRIQQGIDDAQTILQHIKRRGNMNHIKSSKKNQLFRRIRLR